MASVMIPVPLDDAGLPFASSWEPVMPVCHPRGAAAATACWMAGPRLVPPNPFTGAV